MDSLGPSWKFIGPYMRTALGGGDGGFEHIMKHLGPAVQRWLKDMETNSFEYSDENLKIVAQSVQEMQQGADMEEVEAQRDELIIDTLKAKAKATALI